MDVFNLRNTIVGDYGTYVRSFLTIKDERILRLVEEEMTSGFLWPDPLIQLNPSFEPGESIQSLINAGELHPECINIFRDKSDDGNVGAPFRLHLHQVDGLRAARAGDSYILTTGTGSGKSLSYIVPIVDHVLRRGSGQGIQAIIVYPMNALANSQVGELEKWSARRATRSASSMGAGSTCWSSDDSYSGNEPGGVEVTIDEPRTAAERWCLLVMKLVSCDRDLRTVAAWARHVGVSRTALCEACRLVRVSPHDARDFARMLRAIWRSGHDWRPESVLNVADVRTLRKLERRAGFERSARRPPPLETFLEDQTWIAPDSAALLAVQMGCRRLRNRRDPTPESAGAVTVTSSLPPGEPRWTDPREA